MAPEIQAGLTVDVSSDALRVMIRGEYSAETLADSVLSVAAQLRELGVCPEAQRIDLGGLLRQWLETENERGIRILYEGTPPGAASNGRLEWARDFFVTGFEIEEDLDRIDYRRRLDERSVKEGELLCTVIPAKDGQPGMDVFGKPIRAPRAKAAKIRVGPNVRTPDGVEFYATCDGRIRWHRGTLSVDDVYVVEGGVNLRSGNIRHPGTLVVYGDVERDAVVEADKDVDVRGMIDGGSVRAGGEIHVKGGIVGHADSRIEAEGPIRASYILEARVTSNADIIVGKEIVQSTLHAAHSIQVSQGRIVGGITHAGVEVVAGEIGTDGAVKTAVHVAESEATLAQRKETEARLTSLQDKYRQVSEVVAKLSGHADSLTPEKRAALRKLEAQLSNLEADRDAAQEELNELLEQLPAPDSRFVRVLRRLHSETTININGDSKGIAHDIAGPVTIRNRNHEIRIFAD